MVDQVDFAKRVALIAPVSKKQLGSVRTKLGTASRFAFGSRSWYVFFKLDQEREGKPVHVYIYECDGTRRSDFRVSWKATYLKQVPAISGAHPDKMTSVMKPTAKHSADNEEGDWLLFWEFNSLKEIAEQNRVHVATFTLYGKNKPYGKSFTPRGPMLIEHP